MIPVTTELAQILHEGGYKREYVADLIVDGDRKLEDIVLPSCELKWDGNAKIRTQGRAVLDYSDELGTSVVPETLTSWLTPYASYLNVSMRITAADGYSEKVLRGTLKIVGVSDPQDRRAVVGDRLISLGSRVSLQLADAFAVTDRERFPVPFGPSDLTSVWAEIGRLTNLPLLRSVDDSSIRRAVTYNENRLDAVFDLASILGGVPYITPAGQIAIQSETWGPETDELLMGPNGTVVSAAPSDLTDEGIYNQVVIRSHDASESVILATREVTEGPLRYGGPFGRIPYFASSQYVTNKSQALAYADELLPQVSSRPAVPYLISCLPDPRREVGDVVPFRVNGNRLVGRIQEITLAGAGLMTIKALVPPA